MQTKTFNVKTNKVQMVKGHNPQRAKYIEMEYYVTMSSQSGRDCCRDVVPVSMRLMSRCGRCHDAVAVTIFDAVALTMR
jgi:hypothetical protein